MLEFGRNLAILLLFEEDLKHRAVDLSIQVGIFFQILSMKLLIFLFLTQFFELQSNLCPKINYKMEKKPEQQKEAPKDVKLKKCQFRDSLTNNIKKKLFMHSAKLKLLNVELWQFYHGKYVDENWDKLMPYVMVAVCQQVKIINTKCPHAVLSLSSTHFPNLKNLSIYYSQIVNIEALAFLQAQNLELINQGMNMITNFKPLNKVNFPRLKWMLNSKNLDNQFGFERIRLSKKCEIVQEEYFIDSNFDYQDEIERYQPKCNEYRQDYAKIAKIVAQEIMFKRYPNQFRISQKKVNQVLTKKYSNFKNLSQGIIFLCGGFR